MHQWVTALLLACATISMGMATGVAAQSISSAAREDTTVRSYDGRTMPAEIIRITVPEKRADPVRTIIVAALRIPTTAEQSGRPIVFLMGGPGIPGTVMAPIPPYFTLFQRLREMADVVILDQRGLGRSETAIDCSVDETPPPDLFLRRESSRSSAIAWHHV